MSRDSGGRRRIDPSKLRALLPPDPPAEVSEINVGLPGGPKLFSLKGTAANTVLKYALYGLVLYGALAWINTKNKEQRAEVLREVARLTSVIATNAVLQVHN